jgi:hypothetical protein
MTQEILTTRQDRGRSGRECTPGYTLTAEPYAARHFTIAAAASSVFVCAFTPVQFSRRLPLGARIRLVEDLHLGREEPAPDALHGNVPIQNVVIGTV